MTRNVRRLSRRSLLKQAAGSAAALSMMSLSRRVLGANERVSLATVGTANRAGENTDQLNPLTNIVAICDVDSKSLDHRGRALSEAKQYADYRQMFEKEEKNIDAVMVGTPDHHHATASARALAMGKHVYCEKPLTHTVREARTIAMLTKKHKCITQMGTQIHAGGNYRRVVELIQSGAIGSVTRVHTWVGTQYSGTENPAKPPVPATLNWDLWLGAAPQRDYHVGLHPFAWRGYWDFGGGGLADMACHHMDLPFWALGLRHPTQVSAQGPQPHDDRCPQWLVVDYHFPAREKGKAGHGGFLGDSSKNPGGPAVNLTWYNGDKRPDDLAKLTASLPEQHRGWGGGNIFQGDKGYLLADYGRQFLFDADGKHVDKFERPAAFIPDSIGHHKEFVEAIRAGGATTCNFDYAGALTEAVLLGNVAYRSQTKLEWSAAKFAVTNSKDANKWLDKEYRKGWEIGNMA
ncbi:MAG: Gfo/Idh/MocA family oxidoreductase [Phycisphaeraceae bacterium]